MAKISALSVELVYNRGQVAPSRYYPRWVDLTKHMGTNDSTKSTTFGFSPLRAYYIVPIVNQFLH